MSFCYVLRVSDDVEPEEMLRRIRNEPYSLDGDKWKDVSLAAKELVTGLLKIESSQRLKVVDCATALNSWSRPVTCSHIRG